MILQLGAVSQQKSMRRIANDVAPVGRSDAMFTHYTARRGITSAGNITPKADRLPVRATDVSKRTPDFRYLHYFNTLGF